MRNNKTAFFIASEDGGYLLKLGEVSADWVDVCRDTILDCVQEGKSDANRTGFQNRHARGDSSEKETTRAFYIAAHCGDILKKLGDVPFETVEFCRNTIFECFPEAPDAASQTQLQESLTRERQTPVS